MQTIRPATRRAAALLFSLFFALGVSGAWAAGSDYSDDKSAQDTPYGKAVALISQEDYAGAIEQLDLALLKEPENADVLNYLGFSHRKLGNYEEAERYYLRALEIEPEHRGANEYIGELYLETDRPELAEERLQVLDDACFFGCEEYDELKEAIEAYKAAKG